MNCLACHTEHDINAQCAKDSAGRIPCRVCGAMFVPRRKDQKYCGAPRNCRVRLWHHKHPRRTAKDIADVLRKLADEIEQRDDV